MLRHFVTYLLICAFMLPLAAEAMASSAFKDKLHIVFEQHHAQAQHHHHDAHQHSAEPHHSHHQETHAPITLGSDAYFSDYLHVDVAQNHSKSPQPIQIKTENAQDTHPAALLSYAYGLDFSPGIGFVPTSQHHIAALSGRQIYLQTLRLRH